MKIQLISDLHNDGTKLNQVDADLLVIAGDSYEPRSVETNFLNENITLEIERLRREGTKVILLRGNHDTGAIENDNIDKDIFDGGIGEHEDICVAHGLYIDKETQKKFTNPKRIMEGVVPCILNACNKDDNGEPKQPNHLGGLHPIDAKELKEMWPSEEAYMEYYKDKQIYIGHFHELQDVQQKSDNFLNGKNINYIYQRLITLKE